jgi:pyruvate/2-oxoglutarate/acetoin dehydrogenase E1 component
MSLTFYSRAIQRALAQEMRRDPSVFVMGEDVRQSVMGPTRGLVDEFGHERIRNTPISEGTVVGAAVGAAAAGMRPVVDLMMGNFLYPAMDQVVNQAAKLRYMMGGQGEFALVLMAAHGIPGSAAAHHSDAVHPYLMQSGAWTVVAPTSPRDACGLLAAAIRSPDPVAFLFHNSLGTQKEDLPTEEFLEPLGRCRVLAEGRDVTVIANQLMAIRALEARHELDARGVSIEVVDPRTWHPLDEAGIVASVRKTGRMLVLDEARRTSSGGSEILARVASAAWADLVTAPRILATPDLPIPFSPVLEAEIVPSVARIVIEVEKLAGS